MPNFASDDNAYRKLLTIAGALASEKPIAATPGAWANYQALPPSMKPQAPAQALAALAAQAQNGAQLASAPGANWFTAASLFGLPRWAVLALGFGGAWLVFRKR